MIAIQEIRVYCTVSSSYKVTQEKKGVYLNVCVCKQTDSINTTREHKSVMAMAILITHIVAAFLECK